MTFHVDSLVKNPSLLKHPYDNDYVYPHSPSLFNKVTGEQPRDCVGKAQNPTILIVQ